jgi:preprotein translocase subunit SecA
MTGTAVTEAGELWEIYKLDVLKFQRTDHGKTRQRRFHIQQPVRNFNAVIEDVTELSKAGPGANWYNSVEISELLSHA